MPSWDPEIYERYKAYRDRPALDLLLTIPGDLEPREIWDLGCGAGEHAAVLAARHPLAQVHGLDLSADMLAVARRRPARVDWVLADVADFAPKVAPDLIFSNAALHWLPDHATLMPALARCLAKGGVLACQMPQTGEGAWRRALRETAADPAWSAALGDVESVAPLADPQTYYNWLAPYCSMVDIWTTTYLHVLEGDNPIVEWMQGSGLRPYLDALGEPAQRAAFLAAYGERVARAAPPQPNGATLFAFARLFILARR